MQNLGYAVSMDQNLNNLLSKVAQAEMNLAMAKLSGDASVEYDAKLALDKAKKELSDYQSVSSTVPQTESFFSNPMVKYGIIGVVGLVGLVAIVSMLKKKK